MIFFPYQFRNALLILALILSFPFLGISQTGNANIGGAISSNQSVCPGETPALFTSISPASGGNSSAPIEYLWMQTYNFNTPVNTWQVAPGDNDNETYQASGIGLTTYFIRCARRQNTPAFEFVAESNIVVVTVLNSPTAIINGGISTAFTGENVELSASPSTGSTYSWDFDGNGVADCTGLNCSYIYSQPGTYNVFLTVTNNLGCSVTTSTTINVTSPVLFLDPCSCSDPLNFPTPTVYYVHDFILIDAAPGQTWTLSNVTSGQLYDGTGAALPLNTVIPESGIPGRYFLDLWFESGVGFGASFTNGTTTLSTGTSAPCSCSNPLPVELVNFEANLIDDVSVLLKWSTENEIDNKHFVIQRSVDGLRFDEIGIVNGAGNSTELFHYSFQDDAPTSGINYYRLKQVDFNNSIEYSPVREVFIEREGFLLFPSPATEEVNIKVLNNLERNAVVEIVNVNSKLLLTYEFNKDQRVKKISLDEFASGIYFVRITYSDGYYDLGKFIKR